PIFFLFVIGKLRRLSQGESGSLVLIRFYGIQERGIVLAGHGRQEVTAGGADEGGALQLGGVNVGGGVEIGVDETVGPVIKVDGGDAVGRILVNLVVAAQCEGGIFGAEGFLAALGSDRGIGGLAGGGELV